MMDEWMESINIIWMHGPDDIWHGGHDHHGGNGAIVQNPAAAFLPPSFQTLALPKQLSLTASEQKIYSSLPVGGKKSA